MIAIHSYGAVYTKDINLTLTLGIPYTISPTTDAGHVGWVYDDNGNLGKYTVSDAKAFSISSKSYSKNGPYYGVYEWYDYTLTPLKTGFFTFKQEIKWTPSIQTTSACNVTYYINVVNVTSISIPNTLTMYAGESYTFNPIIAQQGATATLTWTSSNQAVATVNANGTVTSVGAGTSTIKCTAQNGVSAQCVVTVNPVKAKGISLDCTEAELIVGEKQQLVATITPSNTTDKSITWSSSNEAVAMVNETGFVTAVGAGSCTIKAATNDGSNLDATCHIEVPSDVLYMNDVVGVPSGTMLVPVYLDNTSAITGLQFELQLPEGVTVAEGSNGNLQATMSDRTTDQAIISSKLSNGNYQFVVFSGTSSALTGNEGAIAYVTLNVAESMAVGEYTIEIKEVELTKTDGTSLHHKDMTAKLTLTEVITGDINGDGRVTVTDAVGIVNYILHRAPSVFIAKAADVNGDGNITISDAVGVVNIVLNK